MTTAVNSSTEKNIFSALDGVASYAHWLPRLGLASIFLYHGFSKFGNLNGTADMMGMPVAMIALLALVEVLGGALVFIGGFSKDILTRIGGLLIIPTMLGAIGMVHWGQWSFVASDSHPMGGMEFQVLILFVATYFVLRGNNA